MFPLANRTEKLGELRTLLLKKGLLDKEEEVIVEMLEDLTHFAYVTGCITKNDVKRFLGLTDQEVKAKLRSWKVGDEGNRSCGLRRNPFSEEWEITKKPGKG